MNNEQKQALKRFHDARDRVVSLRNQLYDNEIKLEVIESLIASLRNRLDASEHELKSAESYINHRKEESQ